MEILSIIPSVVWWVLGISAVFIIVLGLLAIVSVFRGDAKKLEHGIYCYYGRLGQGKTYAMVCDLINLLNNGHVVYTNLTINWHGYEEEVTPFKRLLYALNIKKKFYRYPATNLRPMPVDDSFHTKFGKIRNCVVAIDEAYTVFDSYLKLPQDQRQNILQTRKADRSIYYTTQRPASVNINLRNMTNVFYLCEKIKLPFMILFSRKTYDLAGTADAEVNESKELGLRYYKSKREVFEMYNTKQFVGSDPEFLDENLPTIEYFGLGRKKPTTNKKDVIVVRPTDKVKLPSIDMRRDMSRRLSVVGLDS
jgi:hypothetical protein